MRWQEDMISKALIIVLLVLGCLGYPLRWAWSAETAPTSVIRYTVRILKTLPHSTRSFTQGLVYYQSKLYESTGLYGQSTLQQLDAATGQVQKVLPVPDVFAEGLARWQNRLIQLTWQEQTAFIYRLTDFSRQGIFSYDTEGWGLTTDGQALIMSDGSDRLSFRDPFTFAVNRTLPVTLNGKPLPRLNELEYIEGLVYANIWYETFLVQIDPKTGQVVGVIDAAPLLREMPRQSNDNVLNGIAYNPDTKILYLTGKNWPKIFEVTLVRTF